MRSAVKTTGKVGSYMKIQDFCDMDKFEQIMKNWAKQYRTGNRGCGCRRKIHQ